MVGVLGGNPVCWCPPKQFSPLLPVCWHAITSHKSPGWFLLLLPAMSPSSQAGCALPRVVEMFHYLLWPDHGVPTNPAQLLGLVELVNKRGSEAPAGPVLVHCRYWAGTTWVLGQGWPGQH